MNLNDGQLFTSTLVDYQAPFAESVRVSSDLSILHTFSVEGSIRGLEGEELDGFEGTWN